MYTAPTRWRRHGGEWRGPDPPILFRPLLGLAQIRWKAFFTYRGGYPMYVYCNFYCSPAKKHGSDPPHFFGAGDATASTKFTRKETYIVFFLTRIKYPFRYHYIWAFLVSFQSFSVSFQSLWVLLGPFRSFSVFIATEGRPLCNCEKLQLTKCHSRWGAVRKVCHAPEGGGGLRKCDSLWQGGKDHVTSHFPFFHNPQFYV